MSVIKKIYINRILMTLFIILVGLIYTPIKGYCSNVVVVIDPGHGGDAIGGNMDDRIERDINLITALSMKARLEQYEGVDVYITRDNNDDKEMSRKERFDFAKKHNADFLFSIHYNMSEYHTLYGSEVWVASKGTNYTKGYAFATIEMEALTNEGLFDRGIKNKLDKDKTGEYYGILKYAEDYNIPAVIIEHCHLDEERDSAFWNEEGYKKLGQIDADSVAKFFQLSSSLLGIDNSQYQNIHVDPPANRLDVDATEPEYCELSLDSCDDNQAHFTICAKDSDTYVQYYQISLDGGNSFSRLEPWEDRSTDIQHFSIDRTEDDYSVLVIAYNQYEYSTISNVVEIPGIERIIEQNPVDEEIVEIVIDTNEVKEDKSLKPFVVFVITFAILFSIFNIIFFIRIFNTKK